MKKNCDICKENVQNFGIFPGAGRLSEGFPASDKPPQPCARSAICEREKSPTTWDTPPVRVPALIATADLTSPRPAEFFG